jgi:hypothetical protein
MAIQLKVSHVAKVGLFPRIPAAIPVKENTGNCRVAKGKTRAAGQSEKKEALARTMSNEKCIFASKQHGQ